jgi:hypothetical protein
MAIAEHDPSKIKAKNRGVLKMSRQQLHDFASTKEKNLVGKAASKVLKARRGGGSSE